MPYIVFKGVTRSDDPIFDIVWPLPKDSKRLNIPDRFMIKSMLFAIPFAIMCFFAMIWKTYIHSYFPFNKFIIPLGIILGFLCTFIHEYLHALPYPKEGTAYIGFIPKNLVFYMKCAAPLKRNRFIFMSLLPAILGIVPFAIFLVSPVRWTALNTIMWIMAVMGLISPAPDYMNAYYVLKDVPADASIQDGENGLYWYQD